MKTNFECIVVGCGGLGSAALYWLAREAGAEVLGLEQFGLGHHNGGSQDHSRIIRLAYHQPEYANLAPHAYTAWHEVEAESDVQLVHKTGGLVIEPLGERDTSQMGTRNLAGYKAAMTERDIPFEELNAAEVMARWPQFRLQDHEAAVYQSDSGLVDAAKGNATHIALARARGATIMEQTTVKRIRPVGDTVSVETDQGTFTARRVVIASGAWTNTVLLQTGLSLPLTVTQEQVTYYATPYLKEFSPSRFPVFMYHGVDSFYGFPIYGEVATKLGQHNAGQPVSAENRTFEPDRARVARQQAFLAERIPHFLGPELYTKTCLYTVPPDQNFIIDTVPEHPQISVAVGAGHAYKFASIIGRILSELALHDQTQFPIDAFSLTRTAITDPTFARQHHA